MTLMCSWQKFVIVPTKAVRLEFTLFSLTLRGAAVATAMKAKIGTKAVNFMVAEVTLELMQRLKCLEGCALQEVS